MVRTAATSILTLLILIGRVAFAAVGFYSGSFDPFTKAHEAIARIAAADPQLEKLVIIVNATGSKNFNTATYERTEMIKLALADLGSRIEVRSAPQETKNYEIETIAAGQKIVSVIGADSFNVLPKQVLNDPSRAWVVFRRSGSEQLLQTGLQNVTVKESPEAPTDTSSSLVRTLIGKPELARYVSPAIAGAILQHGYYQEERNPAIALLQKAFYEGSFQEFKADLIVAFPAIDFKNLKAPPYKATQTQGAWAQSFLATALKATSLTGQAAEEFWKKAGGLIFSYPRRIPKAKVSFAEKIVSPSFQPTEILSSAKSPVQKLKKADYQMDLDEYAGDRFPKELVDFIAKQSAEVFIHNAEANEILQYHRSQGFDTFYSLQTPKSHPDAINFLAFSSAAGKYRFISGGLAGADRRAQLKSHLAAAGIKGFIFEIVHKNSRPIFKLTEEGRGLKLSATDLVVIGFKNRIENQWKDLSTWESVQISESGVDMKLFRKGGHQILTVKNVYGDEMKTLLNFLKTVGTRKLVYLGTAGGLGKDMKIGEVLFPSRSRVNRRNISFRNEIELFDSSGLSEVGFKPNVLHGWVQTLLSETKSFLHRQQEAGIESLDIETRYVAEFLNANQHIHGSVALIVSDLPLGHETYDQLDSSMRKVEQSLQSLIPGPHDLLKIRAPLAGPSMCEQLF